MPGRSPACRSADPPGTPLQCHAMPPAGACPQEKFNQNFLHTFARANARWGLKAPRASLSWPLCPFRGLRSRACRAIRHTPTHRHTCGCKLLILHENGGSVGFPRHTTCAARGPLKGSRAEPTSYFKAGPPCRVCRLFLYRGNDTVKIAHFFLLLNKGLSGF